MFALVAFVCFLLALFNVTLGTINMVTLGLLFIALHLMIGWGLPLERFRR